MNQITNDIYYVGADDNDLVLFEHQYDVRPTGISYNSYIILDEKITIMDTIDIRCSKEWFDNLSEVLCGKDPYYLVVSHMEPDHAANIKAVCDKFPKLRVIGNAKTFSLIDQFFGKEFLPADRKEVVEDNGSISLGKHNLTFVFAPMVHWPEVMVTYDSTDKVLFSADAFGRFGSLNKTANSPWMPLARRYYWNIVGKYCTQVKTLLNKAKTLDIDIICPLHGPVLTEDLEKYISTYELWASREPEDPDRVFITHASIYGNTAKAAQLLSEKLTVAGVKNTVCDLATTELSFAVMGAFFCGKIVFAASTYDGGIFPVMDDFLHHLKSKDYQNRKVGIIENGSWAPVSGRLMAMQLEKMKNIEIYNTKVTIKSALDEISMAQLEGLAKEIISS